MLSWLLRSAGQRRSAAAHPSPKRLLVRATAICWSAARGRGRSGDAHVERYVERLRVEGGGLGSGARSAAMQQREMMGVGRSGEMMPARSHMYAAEQTSTHT